jgi:hypothetical protein
VKWHQVFFALAILAQLTFMGCSSDDGLTVPSYPEVQQHAMATRELYSVVLIGLETFARYATLDSGDTATESQLLPLATQCGTDTVLNTEAGREYQINFGTSQCTCQDGVRRAGRWTIRWPTAWPAVGVLTIETDSATVNGRQFVCAITLAASQPDSIHYTLAGNVVADSTYGLSSIQGLVQFSEPVLAAMPGPNFWLLSSSLALQATGTHSVQTNPTGPLVFNNACLFTQQSRFPVSGEVNLVSPDGATTRIQYDADGNTACDAVAVIETSTGRDYLKLTY